MATPPLASPGTSDWKKMKVQELRDELASRGLDTVGLKAALVERLETTATKEGGDGNAADNARKDMDLNFNEDASLDQLEVQKAIGQTGAMEVTSGVVELEVAAQVEPITDITPHAEQVAEGSVAAVTLAGSTGQESDNGNVVAPSTDLEKKQRRAERFGLELMVSEVEKRRLRASRFGDVKTNGRTNTPFQEEGGKMSPTVKDAEVIKRKARAARFGIEEVHEKPAATDVDAAKKKARLARFGLEIKIDPLEQEKKKLRATRFGMSAEAKPAAEAGKEIPLEQSS